MKLTVILSIRESHDEVAALLDKAGVRRFSTVSIRGFKKNKHRWGELQRKKFSQKKGS